MNVGFCLFSASVWCFFFGGEGVRGWGGVNWSRFLPRPRFARFFLLVVTPAPTGLSRSQLVHQLDRSGIGVLPGRAERVWPADRDVVTISSGLFTFCAADSSSAAQITAGGSVPRILLWIHLLFPGYRAGKIKRNQNHQLCLFQRRRLMEDYKVGPHLPETL